MKTMRDQLLSLGAACVCVLGVVLAQDQAPQAPSSDAPPPPAAAAQPAVAAPAPMARPTIIPPAVRRPTTSASALPSRRPGLPTMGSGALPASMTPAASAAASAASQQGSASGEPKTKTTTPALKFENSTADFLLQAYAEETGKTLLLAADLPKAASINLRSQQGAILSREEYLEAIEVTLSMNGIVLEPFGDKFLKVLARKTVRTEGIKILMERPEGGHPEKSQVISQMIQLKAIAISEAQKALEGFKTPEGLIQAFERTNSLLVTDKQENINRMLEIVRFIDQPLVATEEVNVRTIRFAKADDIKKRIEELVAESQKQAQAKDEIKANTSGSPGITRTASPLPTLTRPLPPGLSRLGSPQPAAPTPNESIETLVSDADRGMIRGKVQIISDERSNQLIIITRKENMNFFDKIITVLDIETAPDVKIVVQRLEFANAEDVSTMLNDLIGNVTAKKDEKVPANAKGAASGMPNEGNRSTTLAEAVAARLNRPAPAAAESPSAIGEAGKSKLGALSKDNIKILSDKRTNAIVMMGSQSDISAIKEIIKNMDIQLSQVLIETVVLQVTLGKDLKTGVDWVKRVTENNGAAMRYTVGGGGNGLGGKGDSSALVDLFSTVVTNAANTIQKGATVTTGGSGVEYLMTLKRFNLDAVVSAAKSDSGAKVLTSPVLLTVDNKEASIEATTMRYLYKGVRYSGGYNTGYNTGVSSGYEVPDFEQRDIGLTVKVTPRINPNGMVILSVDEKYETVGEDQQVGSDKYPTINTRKLQADVSVTDRQTVVLGGLVQNEFVNSESGIPLLKDIPWIGMYLFGSTSKSENRTELLVFLTPYVLANADEAEKESMRRKESLSMERVWTKGWSDSSVADPEPIKERLARERRKWAAEDEDRNMQRAYEKAVKAHEELLRKEEESDAKRMNGAASASDAPAPAVTVKSSSSTVEVLKPKGAGEGGSQQLTADQPPVQPAVEESKKSWWKIF